MAGYQEVVTDPSYHGQLVTFTFPLIGNYGVHPDRSESDRVHARAVIAREITNYRFNFASPGAWLDWLSEQGVLVVGGVDTRALTRHIRDKGALRAVVSTEQAEPRTLLKAARGLPSMAGLDLAKAVTRGAPSAPLEPQADDQGRQGAPRGGLRLRHQVVDRPPAARTGLARHAWCRRRPRPATCSGPSQTASSCPTARAIPAAVTYAIEP